MTKRTSTTQNGVLSFYKITAYRLTVERPIVSRIKTLRDRLLSGIETVSYQVWRDQTFAVERPIVSRIETLRDKLLSGIETLHHVYSKNL